MKLTWGNNASLSRDELVLCPQINARKKGFTLLEVLVALVIMAGAITLILQLFSANLRALAVSGDATVAAAKGDTRLREILAEPSLTATSRHEAAETGYPMEIAIAEVLQERTDNLPVKLMEVVLTIHWREGSKEKKLTLRTMKMVDKTLTE